MRLLNLLIFASGALTLVTGPVHRPVDQQAVDGDASLNLENAVTVLVDHEFTRRDEKASQSLEKRGGFAVDGLKLPRVATPTAMVIAGVKITFTMALNWVKQEGGEWLYQYVVESMKVANELNQRLSVEIVSAGKMVMNAHLNALGESTATPPEGATTFALYINELHTEL
ncbi:hypothetical protein E4U17_000148 [Claviceps sp. LM77 group G4]|nr:hypothetical protein E4U33_000339 [Claviceps sp. LM78 group G4]KAG6058310.1 hypothetical protein E4U17_000148 [Claviceps sp. LM77 group G4]KAG6068169.1 hypothetical protein E4U16_008021 [Claviceps sp. LM84 group G4]